MGKKLLREQAEEIKFLEEAATEGKHLYVSGIFLQAGIKNKNGRIYPPPVMDREATRYVNEFVTKGAAYGELGHPNNPGLNSDKISHRITELHKDGNNWVGKAVINPAGNGLIVKGIIETGGAVGVSSRGLGSLKEDKRLGANIVQDDFRLMVGADIVMNPSAPDAWMTAVMEDVEWTFDPVKNEWVQEQFEPIKKEMKGMSRYKLAEEKMRLFQKAMEKLAKG